MTYHQVSAQEREVIALMLYLNTSNRSIADVLHRSVETIRRERKRNCVKGGYSAIAAQRACEERRRRARSCSRKMERPELGRQVKLRLKQRWSPEQIAGRLKCENPANRDLQISRGALYHWLRTDEHRRPYLPCLRRYGCRRRRRPTPRGERARSLAGRPEVINQRQRLGDWEGDLIVGRGHSGALVSLVERVSRLVLMVRVKDRKSLTVNRAIAAALELLPSDLRRSITFDNGSEFAAADQLSGWLNLDVYYADPRSPWQRGTNENTNGLVRQYFPKGTNFHAVRDREVAEAEAELNNRPRKRLAFRTPNEVIHNTAPATLQT
jgi:IS30 family transposase